MKGFGPIKGFLEYTSLQNICDQY